MFLPSLLINFKVFDFLLGVVLSIQREVMPRGQENKNLIEDSDPQVLKACHNHTL